MELNRFNQLLESRIGDVRPLINEQLLKKLFGLSDNAISNLGKIASNLEYALSNPINLVKKNNVDYLKLASGESIPASYIEQLVKQIESGKIKFSDVQTSLPDKLAGGESLLDLFKNIKPASSGVKPTPKVDGDVKSPVVKPTPKVDGDVASSGVKPISKSVSRGNFKIIPISPDVYDLIKGPKDPKFINRLFEIVFYEGFDKRNSMFSKEVISKLNPETKSYLLQFKDIVQKKGLLGQSEMLFKDRYNRLPKTVDEEIEMISGNIWGGYGRRGGAQTKLDEVPEPTNDVINNLMNVAMSENQKKDFIDFYKKLYNK